MGDSNVRTGICQYITYSTGSDAAFGIVTGGSVRDADNVQHRRGQGGVDRIVGGLVTPTVSVTFLPVDVSIIGTAGPGLAWRAASGFPCSDLATSTVKYGSFTEEDFTGAKVNTMSLTCGMGDPLSCTVDFMALNKFETSLGSGVAVTDPHFEWYSAACTVNSTNVSVQSFTINLNNNLRAYQDIGSVTASAGGMYYNRLPLRLLEGNESVRLDVRCANKIACATRGNLVDNLPVTLTFAGQFTNSAGDVLSLSMSTLANATASHPVVVDGEVVYDYSFEAEDNSQPLTITLA